MIWLTNSIRAPIMKTVPVYEAKTRFSELLAAVELGEQITITRRGRPVARIIAAEAPHAETQQVRVAGAFARLRELRKGISLGGDLREAIEGGRD